MSSLHWFLILFVPFLVVGAQGAVAAVSLGGRPVRRSLRAAFVPAVVAGGAWS